MKSALFIALLIILIVPSVAGAEECELFTTFDYAYTNNDATTHRVTFILLNKSTDDMRVVFDPSVLIVYPGETKNFSVTARADEPIEGVQSAYFAIRKSTDVVAYATALFDLSCPDDPAEEEQRPIWRDVLFYASITLIVLILIFFIVSWLLTERERTEPKGRRMKEKQTVLTEKRAPVNVDAMLKAERERKDEPPWWLWVLVAIIVIIVVGAFLYLALSGANVEGFNYGAGINLTNLSD